MAFPAHISGGTVSRTAVPNVSRRCIYRRGGVSTLGSAFGKVSG